MSFFGRPAEPKDIEVPNLPADSTSQLAFSPTADLLAVASWNNEVRLYEVSPQGQAVGKASYSHEGPALSVQWSKVSPLGVSPCGSAIVRSRLATETDVVGLAPALVGPSRPTGWYEVHLWRCRQSRSDDGRDDRSDTTGQYLVSPLARLFSLPQTHTIALNQPDRSLNTTNRSSVSSGSKRTAKACWVSRYFHAFPNLRRD